MLYQAHVKLEALARSKRLLRLESTGGDRATRWKTWRDDKVGSDVEKEPVITLKFHFLLKIVIAVCK